MQLELLKHQWAYPRGISLLAAENVKTCTCTKLSVGVCFVSVVEDLLTHVLSLWWRSYTSGKSSYSSFIVLLNWIVAHNMCWQAFHHSQNKQQQREGWVQAKKESFNKESDTDSLRLMTESTSFTLPKREQHEKNKGFTERTLDSTWYE